MLQSVVFSNTKHFHELAHMDWTFFDWTLFFSIGAILFLATIVVRLAGFGGSLVAMPLLIPLIGLHVASPLMNLVWMTTFIIPLYQQWHSLTLRDVWRLAVLAVLLTPFGVYMLFVFPEAALRLTLGIICVVYAIYRLLQLPTPQFASPHWEWLFGGLAGLFGGAFNVGGVPTVIYASTQPWEPERFRLNMFSFFLCTSLFALISRYVAGQLTGIVVQHWLLVLPFLLAGLGVGQYLTRFVDRERFQTLVLLLLIVLGGRLILTAV